MSLIKKNVDQNKFIGEFDLDTMVQRTLSNTNLTSDLMVPETNIPSIPNSHPQEVIKIDLQSEGLW